MTRRIEVEVEGAKAEFELRDDLAPQTVAALWESLPIETSIRHGKLSGSACFIDVEHGPIASIAADPELPVTSIYKGWIVAFPAPSMGFTELLISYGVAEYRWPTGRKLVTPVAELQGDGAALFDALGRTHSDGEKSVAIRRSGE
ncbi:MAG: hypothetical protein K0S99_75 [Thermomicrobiales bacterium]|nr:hypothetical protein [Thermomicrobiales bacterium]